MGRGARVSDVFTKNPNLKRKKIWRGGGGGGEVGPDGRSENTGPQQICPFNFFEVGGLTMIKCTNYGLTSSIYDHFIS